MKQLFISVITFSTLFFSCQKNAITGRRSINLVPEAEMMTMSYSEYDKFLAENKIENKMLFFFLKRTTNPFWID